MASGPAANPDLAALGDHARKALRASQDRLRAEYERRNAAVALLRGRARAVDRVLREI